MWCAAPGTNGQNRSDSSSLDDDDTWNEIVRLFRIVRPEVERVDFERVHQLRDEMIALINVLSNASCIAAKRVRLPAAAIVAMHVTGRILPCISQPVGD